MLSVGAIHFEDRFCTSNKGRIEEGGRVSVRGAVHMAAALADCRNALVGTGLTQMGVLRFLCLFLSSISGTVSSLQSGEAFTGRRALTIVSSLMSGHDRGHDP